jgi:hypothetical protein
VRRASGAGEARAVLVRPGVGVVPCYDKHQEDLRGAPRVSLLLQTQPRRAIKQTVHMKHTVLQDGRAASAS